MNNAIASITHEVAREDVLRVADILRDPNPIHFDEAAARAAGLAHPINQGPANLAYAVNMMQAAYPAAQLLEIDSRYLANVPVGDTVTAQGTEISREGDIVTLEFRVVNGAGKDAVVGTARLRLEGASR
jgi:acyl dehydratase